VDVERLCLMIRRAEMRVVRRRSKRLGGGARVVLGVGVELRVGPGVEVLFTSFSNLLSSKGFLFADAVGSDSFLLVFRTSLARLFPFCI